MLSMSHKLTHSNHFIVLYARDVFLAEGKRRWVWGKVAVIATIATPTKASDVRIAVIPEREREKLVLYICFKTEADAFASEFY